MRADIHQRCIRGIKIFCIGLLIHFFVYTWITFGLNFDSTIWKIVWMWKELFIVLGLGVVLFKVYKDTTPFKKLWSTFPLRVPVVVLVTTIVFTGVVFLVLQNSTVSAYAMSIRYNFIGFVIFFIAYMLSWYVLKEKSVDIAKRYSRVIKVLLLTALFWWLVIWLIPRLLEFVGYTKSTYEGTVGLAPPARYLTQFNYGYVRNQFLFERPISWGFFLIAFWPLFFIMLMRRGEKGWAVFWGIIYATNIISTFSRAARGAWLVQTLLLILFYYRKHIWKAFIYICIPIVIVLGTVTYIGREQIIYRDFSNTGHIQHTVRAIIKVAQKPLWGWGAGKAGPVTHHQKTKEDYNPENQFLQIWIEYGFLGFAGWMFLYIYLHWIGYRARNSIRGSKKIPGKILNYAWNIFALSLGMLGLTICGFVLHSFVDRMIVYPLMAIFGYMYGMFIYYFFQLRIR